MAMDGNYIPATDRCGLTVYLPLSAGEEKKNIAVIKKSIIAKLGDIGRDLSTDIIMNNKEWII